ncbi:acyl-CoA dehydrogenase family protein [Actinocatenispora sera]|uniref:Medium-chain specific acyl-CoA dehydrogenase, mitochondrial n=1 Tax=Actinocatenispora sera TaxID=390989 RepID=A0A810L6N3_9ACTN|nr:acyl-CoA dehydrogenase family protein [Actinocatenispora sera]BCJ29971.1 acyl-CoA dehydrogenase [Actinocatenispora sera]
MEFGLTDEQRAIRDTVRDFVRKELTPREPDVLARDRRGEPGLTRDELTALQDKARGFGFWGLSTPEQYGGMDLDAVTQALIHTELGRTYVPFVFGGEADNILYEANDTQRAEYLLPTIEGDRISCFAITEPGAGSDAANIRLTARADGDDWLLSGEKTFITNGNDADFAIVIALTDPAAGARGGSTAFLVDRSMGWTSSPIVTMGPAEPASLFFDQVRVPSSHILGEVGQGWRLAMRWIGRGRYLIPARAVGIAERALSMAVEYANTRETFGAPIAANQAIQWMIADSELELEAARLLVLRAAWLVDTGADARHASSMAKLSGATMVNRVIDRVLQVHGGMGYTRELPIERWYREVRLFRIFEGTDEMQRLILARDLLRGYTKVGLV